MLRTMVFSALFAIGVTGAMAPLAAAAKPVEYRFEAVLTSIDFDGVYDEVTDTYQSYDFVPRGTFDAGFASFGATDIGQTLSGSLVINDASGFYVDGTCTINGHGCFDAYTTANSDLTQFFSSDDYSFELGIRFSGTGGSIYSIADWAGSATDSVGTFHYDEGWNTTFTLQNVTRIDAPAPVPVPAAALLLGSGLAGLGVLRRRKAKA